MKRIRAESGAGMIRTSIALPFEVHRRLMHVSVDTGIVATEIARRAVIEWLDHHEATHPSPYAVTSPTPPQADPPRRRRARRSPKSKPRRSAGRQDGRSNS